MNQHVKVFETTSKLIEELVRVERNLAAVALATGVKLPEVMAFANEMPLASYDNDNNNNNRVVPMPLPKGLKNRVRNMAALDKALQLGYVLPLADRWEWTAGSKTLLAYFMGRLLCGDFPKWSKGKELWMQGKGVFPDMELKRLFGVGSLRSLRKKGFFSPLPQGHEMIDSLFDKE